MKSAKESRHINFIDLYTKDRGMVYVKGTISFNLEPMGRFCKSSNFQNPNIAFHSKFPIIILPMRYNSESVQVKLMISENSVVFEDIKVSLGLFISARKSQAELCKNRNIGIYVTT